MKHHTTEIQRETAYVRTRETRHAEDKTKTGFRFTKQEKMKEGAKENKWQRMRGSQSLLAHKGCGVLKDTIVTRTNVGSSPLGNRNIAQEHPRENLEGKFKNGSL